VRGVRAPFLPGFQLGLPAGRKLTRLWSRHRPDLVHVVNEFLLGRSALRAARALRLPLTTSFHTNFHSYGVHYGLGLLEPAATGYLRRFHARAARTLVPTEQTRARLAALGFTHLALVPRGVDTELYTPARRSGLLRAGWGVPDDGLVALSVGRLAPEKNVPLAIRAAAALRGREPRTRLIVVGDGPARRRLERQAPEAVFTGALRGETLAAHYASADVFLFPSLTETFGNVVLEALASGLAVVAFDEAAAGQHVRHGHDGLLAPVGREDLFLAHAESLAAPGLARRLGEAARGTAEALGWDRVGESLEEELLGVVARAQASPTSR
jgi:glycosyltransferase involved in cell wall biosynthesis